MAEMNLVQAVNDALRVEMRRDAGAVTDPDRFDDGAGDQSVQSVGLREPWKVQGQ